MKINNDVNSEMSSERRGFFHDRPKTGFSANNIPTMRSIIILSKAEEEERNSDELDSSSQYSI